MTNAQRIALLVGGLVVAVAAFVILRPQEDDEPAREANATGPAETAPTRPETESEEPPPPAPPPKPEFTQIRIRGGQPVGGEAKVSVEKGDTIRLAVRSDVADEVHVHGYDHSREVAPGRPVRMQFKANLEGVFEVELEHRAVPIAQLEVTP
jgi:hypothetical protein